MLLSTNRNTDVFLVPAYFRQNKSSINIQKRYYEAAFICTEINTSLIQEGGSQKMAKKYYFNNLLILS